MPSPSLALLMGVLQRTRSPWERLRIVARAARQVRNLSPEERYRLALQIGVEGASEAVEAVAEGDDELRESLLAVLQEASETDPSRLRSLVRDLKNPQARGALLREGAAAVTARLVAAPPPAAEPAPPARPPAATPAPTAAPPPVTDLADLVPSAPAPEPAAPAPADAPPSPGLISAPPVAAPPPRPESMRPTRTSKPRPAEKSVPPPERPRASRPPSRPSPLLGMEELAAIPSVVRRLRRLREADLTRMSIDGLAALLEAFPDGWQRRRAVEAILENGGERSTTEALQLLAMLTGSVDRRFCVRGLLRERDLDEPDREALLASVG